jgi:hypothetical protein
VTQEKRVKSYRPVKTEEEEEISIAKRKRKGLAQVAAS